MNNKGFTLVELIATIALLAIISVISFVSINAVINNNKVSNCKNLVGNVKSATKEYVSDNRYSYENNDTKRFNVKVLIDGNYFSEPVKDPFNTSEDLEYDDIQIIVDLKDDYTVNTITIKNASGMTVNCDSGFWKR